MVPFPQMVHLMTLIKQLDHLCQRKRPLDSSSTEFANPEVAQFVLIINLLLT